MPLFGVDAMEKLLQNAYEKNKELKSLESSLKVINEEIKLANKLDNPVLNFGATDIWLSDFSNRDSEPMQAYYLGISQNFPLTKKLETKKEISKNDFQIQKYKIEDKKLKFKSNVAIYIYTIALLEEKILLFTKLENNILKLEEFFKELYKTNRADQNQILKLSIIKDEIRIKKIDLYKLLQTKSLNLEKITYSKYENINIDLKVKDRKLFAKDENHPKLLNLKEKIKKYENISKYEKQKKNSDLKVSLTYFQRDDKFEDYVNLRFTMPLSLYKKEALKSAKAKFKTIELKNSYEDMKFKIQTNIKIFQTNLDSSKKRYEIIKNEILPKLNQMQKNLENYHTYKNINSTSLIKNINKILKYEIEALNEKQKYFANLAKVYYFAKEIKWNEF